LRKNEIRQRRQRREKRKKQLKNKQITAALDKKDKKS